MNIYLAGGVTGNINKFWKDAMKIYLAGSYSRKYVIEESMKMFLAGIQGKAKDFVITNDEEPYSKIIHDNKPYILESFFYIRNQYSWLVKMRPFFKEFLLDSGAFTYMVGNGDKTNWDAYITEYAEFIKESDIDLFFELDIDSIVGLKEVERLRNKLESITGKQCIPVWHKSRGLEYWKKLCREYSYVAIGGLVTKEIKGNEYDIFIPLLKIARENNCKVHGLGFTNLEGVKKYPFYSVDSTAWLYGNRGGFIYNFTGSSMEKIMPKGMRLKSRIGAIHNFTEWVKFSQYAETNL